MHAASTCGTWEHLALLQLLQKEKVCVRCAEEASNSTSGAGPPAVLELLECEMVARATRRIVDGWFRYLLLSGEGTLAGVTRTGRDCAALRAFPGPAIVAMLNALLGAPSGL